MFSAQDSSGTTYHEADGSAGSGLGWKDFRERFGRRGVTASDVIVRGVNSAEDRMAVAAAAAFVARMVRAATAMAGTGNEK